MNTETLLAYVALGVVAGIALILAKARDYEDGVVGRIALMLMFAGGALIMCYGVFGNGYDFSPETVVFFIGTAMFMLRHAFRFDRFRRFGRYKWKSSDEQPPC